MIQILHFMTQNISEKKLCLNYIKSWGTCPQNKHHGWADNIPD